MSSGYLLRSPQESRSYTTWAKHWMPLSYKTVLSQHLFCQHFQFTYSLFLSGIMSSVYLTYSSFTGHSDLCLCTTLQLSLMLFSIYIYYGREEGRWSLSLMTVLTSSNKWRGVRLRLSQGYSVYIILFVSTQKKHWKSNKGSLVTSLSCFIS